MTLEESSQRCHAAFSVLLDHHRQTGEFSLFITGPDNWKVASPKQLRGATFKVGPKPDQEPYTQVSCHELLVVLSMAEKLVNSIKAGQQQIALGFQAEPFTDEELVRLLAPFVKSHRPPHGPPRTHSIPAYCFQCGLAFPSSYGITDSQGIQYIGCKDQCPKCGQPAPLLEGTYDCYQGVLALVRKGNNSDEIISAINKLAEEAHAKEMPPEVVAERADEIKPGLGQLVKKYGKLVLFLVRLLLRFDEDQIDSFYEWACPPEIQESIPNDEGLELEPPIQEPDQDLGSNDGPSAEDGSDIHPTG